MTPNEQRQSRSEQRDAARAKARALREASARKEKQKSVLLKLSLGVGLTAVVALIVVAVVSSMAPAPTPSNLLFDNGIKIGAINGKIAAFTDTQTPTPNPAVTSGKIPNIQVYLDYQCPFCGAFDSGVAGEKDKFPGNMDQIGQWVKDGKATLEIHPISFLDGRATPNTYSSRAANAALCVATYSPDQYFDFNRLLFDNQPAEGTAGPENPALVADTKSVGVQNESKIADCINNKTYGKWLSNTTATVLNPSYTVPGTKIVVNSTPTILVNGHQYLPASNGTQTAMELLGDPATFAAWFMQFAAN